MFYRCCDSENSEEKGMLFFAVGLPTKRDLKLTETNGFRIRTSSPLSIIKESGLVIAF
jgi:hypothetical protein